MSTTHVAATIAAHTPKAVPILIAMVVSGAIGSAIGKSKGHGATGFFLGAFLGLIGWIIVGVMKPANAAPAQAGVAGAIPNAPPCQRCGQPGIWAQTYWSCSRCQAAIHVGPPQQPPYPPQQHPQ